MNLIGADITMLKRAMEPNAILLVGRWESGNYHGELPAIIRHGDEDRPIWTGTREIVVRAIKAGWFEMVHNFKHLSVFKITKTGRHICREQQTAYDNMVAKMQGLEEENKALSIEITQLRAVAPVRWSGEYDDERLTPQEMMVVNRLLLGKGHPVKPERLLNSVSSTSYSDRMISVLICRIRKFGYDVKTHWGRGYSLTHEGCPVECQRAMAA